MAKVIFITQFNPERHSDGGSLASYQILSDCCEIVGTQDVVLVSYQQWMGGQSGKYIIVLDRLMRRLWNALWKNPLDILNIRWLMHSAKYYSSTRFSNYYQKLLRDNPDARICVVEHIGFSDVIKLNKKLAIKTIIVNQNIESLDNYTLPNGKKKFLLSALVSLRNDYYVYGKFDAVLFRSKVEAGLFTGLGLPSVHYQYIPTGKSREKFLKTRSGREANRINRNLFVMIGSYNHATTRESFNHIISKFISNPLPRDIRLIIGGKGTEAMTNKFPLQENIEIRGWVSDEEFEELIQKAACSLVVQEVGFGAPCRVTAMACVGVPVITSSLSNYTLALPPGVLAVEEHGMDWREAIIAVRDNPQDYTNTLNDYEQWEKNQHNSLKELIAEYSETGRHPRQHQ